ncbi:FAD dependent oxidoreductase domain-containing protein [Cavenderia fasciculata]|uniref:FAD dependent oxidoreductase domain-containing protein n=1 Tax=Cavenderia fasciculata TaxID=261658 RepID=F4PH17_CACFS|nr:FAD dependent oxidoreductase domain-containing protein [Cavenderia fasciculata]EGG25001.1 FAD dependent oxidoreductase domain-containing protein [Cavenderia fasciculata]|eukprot:XP_004362852.1 FAD dependent oxidoreductase domain-containing protein [Cavenderia fasciculata]
MSEEKPVPTEAQLYFEGLEYCVFKDHPKYNQQFQTFNSRYDTTPHAFCKPRTIDDIKDIVLYAKSKSIKVVCKSGGHSCTGFSVEMDAIVIDMRDMKHVYDVDTVNKTVKVQCGALVEDLYDKTTIHGLAVPGGSCPTVGIGGLVTGGGANYLSPKFGYMCDNVLEMTVVLSDGSVVVCTEKEGEHSDLFWAMRGGGHTGLGVLVDVTFRLYEIEKVYFWTTTTIPSGLWTDAFVPAMLSVIEYSKTMDQATYFNFESRKRFVPTNKLNDSHNGNQSPLPTISIIFLYNGDYNIGRQQFKTFYDRLVGDLKHYNGTIDTSKITTNIDPIPIRFIDLIKNGPRPTPKRIYSRCRMIHSLTVEQIQSIQPLIYSALPTFDIDKDGASLFTLNMYYQGGKMTKKATDYNAFPFRDTPWSISLTGTYTNKDNDQLFGQWSKNAKQVFDKITDNVYPNYPEPDLLDWGKSLYSTNLKRLSQVKSKYDQINLFKSKQTLDQTTTTTTIHLDSGYSSRVTDRLGSNITSFFILFIHNQIRRTFFLCSPLTHQQHHHHQSTSKVIIKNHPTSTTKFIHPPTQPTKESKRDREKEKERQLDCICSYTNYYFYFFYLFIKFTLID